MRRRPSPRDRTCHSSPASGSAPCSDRSSPTPIEARHRMVRARRRSDEHDSADHPSELPAGRRRRRGEPHPGRLATEARGGRHQRRGRHPAFVLRRLARRLSPALGLGQGQQEHPPGELLVPGQLQLEHLREGGDRLARRAGRRLSADPPRRPGLQPPRLPEGRLLQRAHVRPLSGSLSAEARRAARIGEVEAAELGRGHDRGRRRDPRYPGESRLGSHRLGHRAPLQHGDPERGASAHEHAPRHDGPRRQHRNRRRPPGHRRDLREDRLRTLRRRLLSLGSHPHLGRQSDLHADPPGPLPPGSTLQGREARVHRTRLQRLEHPRRPLRTREARL